MFCEVGLHRIHVLLYVRIRTGLHSLHDLFHSLFRYDGEKCRGHYQHRQPVSVNNRDGYHPVWYLSKKKVVKCYPRYMCFDYFINNKC